MLTVEVEGWQSKNTIPVIERRMYAAVEAVEADIWCHACHDANGMQPKMSLSVYSPQRMKAG